MKPIRPSHLSPPIAKAEPSYPVQIDIGYVLKRRRRAVEQREGRIVAMGQHELTLESSEPIAPGLQIEFNVAWPCPELALVVKLKGQTVRSEGNRTAVRIAHYEFESANSSRRRVPEGSDKASKGTTSPRTAPLAT